jgi:tRNA(fMet)-specific endonuclease VapC
MAGKLLDTNAALAYLSRDEAFQNYIADEEDVFVPMIAIGELYYGAYKSAHVDVNLARIASFAAARKVLHCNLATAQQYGNAKHALRKRGRPIPDNDMWIAAIARQYDLVLVTRDRHFSQIDGLHIEAW